MFFNFSFPQKCGLCTTPRATCLGGCRAGRKHGTSAPVSSPAKPCTGMRMQRPWDAAARLLPECPALKSPLVNDGDSEAHRKFQNLIAEPVTSAPTSQMPTAWPMGWPSTPQGYMHAARRRSWAEPAPAAGEAQSYGTTGSACGAACPDTHGTPINRAVAARPSPAASRRR